MEKIFLTLLVIGCLQVSSLPTTAPVKEGEKQSEEDGNIRTPRGHLGKTKGFGGEVPTVTGEKLNKLKTVKFNDVKSLNVPQYFITAPETELPLGGQFQAVELPSSRFNFANSGRKGLVEFIDGGHEALEIEPVQQWKIPQREVETMVRPTMKTAVRGHYMGGLLGVNRPFIEKTPVHLTDWTDSSTILEQETPLRYSGGVDHKAVLGQVAGLGQHVSLAGQGQTMAVYKDESPIKVDLMEHSQYPSKMIRTRVPVHVDFQRISAKQPVSVEMVREAIEKPVHVELLQDHQPIKVHIIKKERPIQVQVLKKERPIHLQVVKDEKPANVHVVKEEKPVRMTVLQQQRPVHVELMKGIIPVHDSEIVTETLPGYTGIVKEQIYAADGVGGVVNPHMPPGMVEIAPPTEVVADSMPGAVEEVFLGRPNVIALPMAGVGFQEPSVHYHSQRIPWFYRRYPGAPVMFNPLTGGKSFVPSSFTPTMGEELTYTKKSVPKVTAFEMKTEQ